MKVKVAYAYNQIVDSSQRDNFGKFIKKEVSVTNESSASDATLVDVKINNPVAGLFNAVKRSITRGVTIEIPAPVAIAIALAIFGGGGFFFGRQSIDLGNLFIQKNGQVLDVNQYVNKNIIVTGHLNQDKKTFSVFSINTVGP